MKALSTAGTWAVKLIPAPKRCGKMGQYGRFFVIEDPAGAMTTLFEPAKR